MAVEGDVGRGASSIRCSTVRRDACPGLPAWFVPHASSVLASTHACPPAPHWTPQTHRWAAEQARLESQIAHGQRELATERARCEAAIAEAQSVNSTTAASAAQECRVLQARLEACEVAKAEAEDDASRAHQSCEEERQAMAEERRRFADELNGYVEASRAVGRRCITYIIVALVSQMPT